MSLICPSPTFQVKGEIIPSASHLADIHEKSGGCAGVRKPSGDVVRDGSVIARLATPPHLGQGPGLRQSRVYRCRQYQPRGVRHGYARPAPGVPLDLGGDVAFETQAVGKSTPASQEFSRRERDVDHRRDLKTVTVEHKFAEQMGLNEAPDCRVFGADGNDAAHRTSAPTFNGALEIFIRSPDDGISPRRPQPHRETAVVIDGREFP